MTDIDTIRLLINDTAAAGNGQVFTDPEVQSFLDLEGDVKLAAAQALDVIASNEALVKQRIRTLDLQTDGPAVATALRAHAELLRGQTNETGEFEFTTVGLGVPELTEHPYWPFV